MQVKAQRLLVFPNHTKNMERKAVLKFISHYAIHVNGKTVEYNIKDWQTALKRAKLYQYDLFSNIRKVEILNIWTGEIVSIEEAERRANKIRAKSQQGAVIPN